MADTDKNEASRPKGPIKIQYPRAWEGDMWEAAYAGGWRSLTAFANWLMTAHLRDRAAGRAGSVGILTPAGTAGEDEEKT